MSLGLKSREKRGVKFKNNRSKLAHILVSPTPNIRSNRCTSKTFFWKRSGELSLFVLDDGLMTSSELRKLEEELSLRHSSSEENVEMIRKKGTRSVL